MASPKPRRSRTVPRLWATASPAASGSPFRTRTRASPMRRPGGLCPWEGWGGRGGEGGAGREGAAIPAPDPMKGEVVKACVALREGAAASPEELIAFCRQRLAPHKVPKAVEFRDTLPKTLIGKILRRAL